MRVDTNNFHTRLLGIPPRPFPFSPLGTPKENGAVKVPAAPAGPVSADVPTPVKTGTSTYYTERAADFRRRNPGMEPPPYYLEYGDKYVKRFASLDQTDLSPQGLEWRDKTLKTLQELMEKKRIEDPEGFAKLERDPEAFKQFAYATHPEAYMKSGLFDLPAQDLAVIARTPDLRDVLTKDGIGQTLITLGKLTPRDVADIAVQTAKQALRNGPFPVAREAERGIAVPWSVRRECGVPVRYS